MARRPRIGITLELDDPLLLPVERNLREPLSREGAIVVALPRDTPPDAVPDLIADLDGVLVSGGEDVDPAHYGEERHPTVNTVPAAHDAFELALARAALEQGVPILGICRGSQVLAVADGGTLVQDVPSQVEAAQTHMVDWKTLAEAEPGDHWHPIEVEPSSRLAGWIGDGAPLINSFHHQAVARTGERLRPVARAADGVIEATESAPDAPYAVGLQWHNEFMWRRDARWLGPFRDLVAAARRRADTRV
ncbi:MAG: gamma-glutamyl-gamma-aminobutyrate hydrolase family protein [Gaiellales bacterium]